MKNGEIWLVDFEPQRGTEIKKARPALIISNDLYFEKLPLRIVVPFRDTKPHHYKTKLFVVIEKNKQNGLLKTSTVDCTQVKSFDTERFKKLLGKISQEDLEEITNTVALCINL